MRSDYIARIKIAARKISLESRVPSTVSFNERDYSVLNDKGWDNLSDVEKIAVRKSLTQLTKDNPERTIDYRVYREGKVAFEVSDTIPRAT